MLVGFRKRDDFRLESGGGLEFMLKFKNPKVLRRNNRSWHVVLSISFT